MRHYVQVEGFGVRLRPARLGDAAFLVWLRHLDHVKGRVGDSAADAAAQQVWLERYFDRPGDYYFIVETLGGIPAGSYGIYDVAGTRAESGRWIMRPETPAAIPCAILGFDTAFGRLGLKQLRVRTVSTNRPVLSLNRKLGMRQTHVETGALLIGGKPVDLVNFILDARDWPPFREQLLAPARLAEKQIEEWEAAQLGNLSNTPILCP